MNIPGSFDQFLLFVLCVLPGITFSTVRVAIRGWRGPDYSVGARILDALFVSAVFDGLYLLAFGGIIATEMRAGSSIFDFFSTWNIFLALLSLIGVPALVALVAFLRLKVGWAVNTRNQKRLRVWFRNSYTSVPQAWDHKVLNSHPQFVRVRTEEGRFYGGWYAAKSLASTYPNPRDIFIESQWKLDESGKFLGKIQGTSGVWLSITDKTIVEWIDQQEMEMTE